MDTRIKNKWLHALRSGEYKQDVGALNTGHGFCCLGVLCDIYSQENDVPWKKEVTDFEEDGCVKSMHGEMSVLPKKVMEWAGLGDKSFYLNSYTTTDPGLISEGREKREVEVTDLNDEYGFTFKDIANLIEEQL